MRWNNVKDIVDGLEENFSDTDLSDISLVDLEEMVKSLSEFEDHETIVTKRLVTDVLEAWLDHRGEI